MKDIKAVIFDCDGVMFDTKKVNEMYYNSILSHMEMPPLTREKLEYAHMHSVPDVMRRLFGGDEVLRRAEAFRNAIDYRDFVDHMIMEPNLIYILQRLRPGYVTAVATNRTDTMPLVMERHGISHYFDRVVCAMDVKHPKPAPDQLLDILNFFNIRPRQAVFTGDSEVDEQAAAAAGTIFIAYKNRRLNADFHISDHGELEAVLNL